MAAVSKTQAELANDPLGTDVAENAKKHLVQPWPVAGSVGEDLRTILRASDGILVYDEHGTPLIDGPAGMWCVNIGHRRRDMVEAISSQLMDMAYCSPWYTTSGASAELAARIASHAPGDLEHVFFTTGGSTAVETALRFAQFFNNALGRPEKKLIVSRGDAYHGSTYLAGSVSGKARDKNWMDQASEKAVFLSSPNTFRRPKGQTEAQFCDQLIAEFEDKITEIGAEKIAVYIAELVLASGGVIMPPAGYVKRMHAVCRAHDILYISDEVVTAFGRLGHVFASKDEFGIEPDMITFAKGVTSGYFPLGGAVISKALFERIREAGNGDAMFAHGYTNSSHPAGCAAGVKNLDILIDEHILETVRDETGPYFQKQLNTLEELPLVGEVRGIGLMACVECVVESTGGDTLEMDYAVGSRIDAHCQALGLLVRPIINMCVMSPPLTITKSEIDQMVGILREGITRTQDDLRKEGIWNG
jgi:adenosylmethionine-8-amino-7-oxononanoate aminotransferase